MFYTPAQAVEALDDILNQCHNDELFDVPVSGATIEALRAALRQLEAEKAYSEYKVEERSDLHLHQVGY